MKMEDMEIIKDSLTILWNNLLFINMVFAIIIVFFERRNPKSVWAWLLLMYFIPVVGFIFYLFLGQSMRKRKMFRMKEVEDNLNEAIRNQENILKNREDRGISEKLGDFKDLAMYNLETDSAVLFEDNDIDIFTDGNEKFDALTEDIRNAEHFIHIQYYIIRKDILFERLLTVLEEKAAQGVEVRILFDSMGCRNVSPGFWRKLNKKGIMTAEFFPAILGRLQLRINYRNHRKVVVIDNKKAWVGGFNIGKEYIDLSKKFGHWRDTHLRIQGSSVIALHLRFILDWNYAARENLFQRDDLYLGVEAGKRGDNCAVQIISSGPDNSMEQIHDNYLRLIAKARESIYIQTPYFIPDEAILNALLIAVHSGIEVNLMIPCKPDHPFVYWATYSYMGDLVLAGANCYTYDNGFLHSKGLIVDGKVMCYGTANMDIRSFALNFEVNAVVFDEKKTREMVEIFQRDLKHCTKITKDVYLGRNLRVRFKEQVCRLLSPLL